MNTAAFKVLTIAIKATEKNGQPDHAKCNEMLALLTAGLTAQVAEQESYITRLEGAVSAGFVRRQKQSRREYEPFGPGFRVWLLPSDKAEFDAVISTLQKAPVL